MMKRLLFLLIPLCVVCHRGDSFSHKSVRRAAQNYYTMLMDGNYGEFVDAMEHDSLPADKRQELIDMVGQFVALQEGRGGLTEAIVARDSLFDDSLAYVFLELSFGDSTREEVLVPMVLHDARWRMR